MQDSVKYNATYADLEAVPPHLVAEILHGKLVTHPQPTGLHSEIHYSLGFVLGEYRQGLGQRGGWRFLTEPELHMGNDVAVPELAGWRIEHIPPPPEPDPLTVAKIRHAPDWICEVLSPSTEKYDRGEKREIYAAAEVKHLWLIDPRTQVLEAFELTHKGWLLIRTFTDGDMVRIAPFDEIEFRLASIWPPSRQPPPVV